MDKPKQGVWICVPSHSGTIMLATAACLMRELYALNEAGIGVNMIDESGNAMIAHGRSVLMSKFHLNEEGATDMIFVDHDVTWDQGAMVRLLSYPVDVVGGAYPKRSDPLDFHMRWLDKPGLWADPKTGLLEVRGIPTGFLRITRNCVDQLVRAYPYKRFADTNVPGGMAWALFDNLHEGDCYFGEDYSFTERWARIGGKCWVDPQLRMGHIGIKQFHGCIGDWLLNRHHAVVEEEKQAEIMKARALPTGFERND